MAENIAVADGPASCLFGMGEPNEAFARYFVGASYLNPLTDPAETQFVANVTFEPGCRNNWHVHHAEAGGGQILICVGGRGYCRFEGEPVVEMRPGDCVNIPAGVRHWHGAAPGSWFSHLAVEVPGEAASTEWLEPVSDEEYAALA